MIENSKCGFFQVKLLSVDSNKEIYKRKTGVVKGSVDPVFDNQSVDPYHWITKENSQNNVAASSLTWTRQIYRTIDYGYPLRTTRITERFQRSQSLARLVTPPSLFGLFIPFSLELDTLLS